MSDNGGITYFVPGLPDGVEDHHLREHFQKYGQVTRAEVARSKGSASSRCFAYVTIADESSRDQIVTDLHEFGDRQIRVLLNKESLHSPEAKKVHLGHLGHHITPDQIREAFSNFGIVLDVHTPKDPRTGERKNYGFVTLGSDESFAAAIAEGSIQVGDCMVSIKPSAQSKGEEVYRGPKGGASPAGKGMGKGYDDPWGMDNGMAGYGWGGKGYPEWDPYAWDGKGGDKGGRSGGGDSGCIGGRPEGRGGVKYFVPGLPDSVTDEELKAHFSFYGKVLDAAVVTEKGSEQSRGFGYVTMADNGNREALLTDRHDLGGKPINIMLTKDSLTGSDVKKVHLGKLREDVQADSIRDVFQKFGVVLDVHTPKDPKTGDRKNFGFVTFGTQEAFDAAVSAGSAIVQDCKVTIKPAAQSRQDEGGGDMGYPSAMMGKGKGYDPWSAPAWGPPPGKGWGYGYGGYGGKGWGPWDAWGGGWGGPPMWGKGWDGKGGWDSPDMWSKGGWDGPYGKGGKWGGKGADSWGGKGGDAWSGKGSADSWGGKGEGKDAGKSEGGSYDPSGWGGSDGARGAEAEEWGAPSGGWHGKGGGGYEDQWGGKGKGGGGDDWGGGKDKGGKGGKGGDGGKGGKGGDGDNWGQGGSSWGSQGGGQWDEPARGGGAEWEQPAGGGIPSGYGPQRLSPGARGNPYMQ